MEPFQRAHIDIPSIKELRRNFNITEEEAREQRKRLKRDKIYINDIYQVNIDRNEGMIHLSIKRIDKGTCKDWRHFQMIKNELVGEEYEAVELYPSESRLVDGANQYHLWVPLKEDGSPFKFPFGFENRLVDYNTDRCNNTKQRGKDEY